MRVTSKHIQDLIQSAKLAGANKEHLALLEGYLEEKQALGSKHNAPCPSTYVSHEIDSEGRKTTIYSTAPISDRDKSYFE
jgi:hypothetical protein